MKFFKTLLVSVVCASLTFPSSLVVPLFASDRQPWRNDEHHRHMPHHRHGFTCARDTVQPPCEDKKTAETDDSRWSKVIDQDGELYWPDTSRGKPEEGKMYSQVLTPLSDEEKALYADYIKHQQNEPSSPEPEPEPISSDRWSKVIDQDGELYWPDTSRGKPEEGKMYSQVLTPLSDEEKALYAEYLKTVDNVPPAGDSGPVTKVPATPGEKITLSNGIELTGQDDGFYKDEDGNKWMGVEDQNGNQSFRQLGFPKGTQITLTDGTTLTSTDAFEYSEDGTLPKGVRFTDQDGNTWITRDEGNFSQISFQAGSTIELTNSAGTTFILTSTQAFQLNDDGSVPDGVVFKDADGNRWRTKGGSYLQIDFAAGSQIALTNGTVLTSSSNFSYKDDWTLPDGIAFTDQDGNRWTTKDGNFQQLGFSPGSISLSLSNGCKLTNATQFEPNADGSLPAGLLFKDQYGNIWTNTDNGQFRIFDSLATPFANLRIMQELNAASTAEEKAAILSRCDPVVAHMLLMGVQETKIGSRKTKAQVFSDQAVIDILNAMDHDSLVELMNTFLTVKDPEAGNHTESTTHTIYNDLSDERMAAIFSGLVASQQLALVSDDKFSAALASVLLTQSRSQENTALWNGLSADRAAAIANQLFGIDRSAVENGPYTYYKLDRRESDRINTLTGILADMDPEKAAAMLNSRALTLTNAAKLLANPPESIADIFSSLAGIDPERAQNIKEVVDYLSTKKNAQGTGALIVHSRPLTAVEAKYYQELLGYTPVAVREVLQADGTTLRQFMTSLTTWSAVSRVSIDGVETFEAVYEFGENMPQLDIRTKIAGLSAEEAVKMLTFLGSQTAAALAAQPEAADSQSSSGYNCATYALSELLAGKSLDEIKTALAPYTVSGLTSLLGMQAVANENGLDMAMIKAEFPNLINDAGAIVHLSSGHYVTLVSSDATSGTVTYKDNGVIKAESIVDFEKKLSGYALVLSSDAGDGVVISDAAAAGIWGAESEAASGLISGPGLTAKMRAMNNSGNEQWSSSNVNGGGINHGLAISGSSFATYSVIDGGSNTLTAVSVDVAASLVKVGYKLSTSLSSEGFTPVAVTSINGVSVVSAAVQAVELQAASLGFKAVTAASAQGLPAISGVTALKAADPDTMEALSKAVKNDAVDRSSQYAHVVSVEELFKEKYGVDIKATDPASREWMLKSLSSQRGFDIKMAVSSSGVTYTVYHRGKEIGPDGRRLIDGKEVYRFTYADNGGVTGYEKLLYRYQDGGWILLK